LTGLFNVSETWPPCLKEKRRKRTENDGNKWEEMQVVVERDYYG
jgi:hypothetical protein